MNTLTEVAWVFAKLGFLGFGGPAAHIAMMKAECVRRRQWLTEAEFLDLLGMTHLIPGPNSTEMAIHVGYLRCGWPGLIVAGLCFILPAAILVSLCTWLYVAYGTLPVFVSGLQIMKPVILAVVVQAIVGLCRPALKTPFLGIVGLGVLGLNLGGIDALLLLFGSGAISGLVLGSKQVREQGYMPIIRLLAVVAALIILPSLLTYLPGQATEKIPFGLMSLFLFFLKVGSVLYGSGYVLLTFLHETLVIQWQWLTEVQLLDATLIGQVTPGPVFTTATFIGYILGGIPGAGLATLGIFLPSFILVAMSGRLLGVLRKSPLTGAFLDGVNVAALGLMAAVTLELGQSALVNLQSCGVGLASVALLVFFRINSAWLILAAAVLGVAQTIVN